MEKLTKTKAKAMCQRAFKDAEKIKKLVKQMEELEQKVRELEENNRWINYTDKEFASLITEEESIKLCEASNVINYELRQYKRGY